MYSDIRIHVVRFFLNNYKYANYTVLLYLLITIIKQ